MTAAAPLPRESAALGIDAKSVDRPGDAMTVDRTGRALRYRLKRTVERLLYVPGAERQARVCTCQRRRKGEHVRVMRDTATGRAYFNGLESCSNVWLCPLCSLVIVEERRRDLQAAIDAWARQGGEVYLMNLTAPHVRRDTLANLLELLRQAAKRLCQSKAYRRASDEAGRIGNVRSLEVTWGAWHGWHPHFHILIFAKRGQLAKFEALADAWVDALIKVGAAERSQRNDMLHGRADGSSPAFLVHNGDYAAEYVAKYGSEPSLISKAATGETWGAARELVKGQAKVSRGRKGRTAFSLLLDYEAGDARAGALFREYAETMKGERQLYWSPGLRAALGLGPERDDSEVVELSADELRPKVEKVGELDREAWNVVISRNGRWLILKYAELHGADGIAAVLAELRARPPTHSSELTASPKWG